MSSNPIQMSGYPIQKSGYPIQKSGYPIQYNLQLSFHTLAEVFLDKKAEITE